jgi:hypothetical protein
MESDPKPKKKRRENNQQNSFAEMEGTLNQSKNEEKTISKIASMRSKTIPSGQQKYLQVNSRVEGAAVVDRGSSGRH